MAANVAEGAVERSWQAGPVATVIPSRRAGELAPETPRNERLSVFGSRSRSAPFRTTPVSDSREPEVEEVAERDHALVRVDHAPPRELDRGAEADDPGRVLGARAAPLLVAGAVEERLDREASPDDQAADSLRSIKLVGRDRDRRSTPRKG